MAKAKEKVNAREKGEKIGKAIGGAIGKEIDKEIKEDGCKDVKWGHHHRHAGGGGAVYGLGFIGALVFFLQHATSFWMGVLGILKAIVWPALLIYKLLGMAGF